MLVFVVAGGVQTAVSFLWGITSFSSTALATTALLPCSDHQLALQWALWFSVLSAYIAESIGKSCSGSWFCCRHDCYQGPNQPNTGMIDAGALVLVLASWVVSLVASLLVMSSLVLRSTCRSSRTLTKLKASSLPPTAFHHHCCLVMLGISGPMAAINTG